MDITKLVRNAARVSRIFNALAIVVLVVGIIVVITALVVGIGVGTTADSNGAAAIAGGVLYAVVALIYTIITWASVQLAALVAGYIGHRLGDVPAGAGGYPGQGYPTAPGAP